MFEITTERPEDGPAIEDLLDQAFGYDRHAKTSYRYRRGRAPIGYLSLVARGPRGLVGSIRYWPVEIGHGGSPALLLGPLAIHPAHQGAGIGRGLAYQSLDMAWWARHRLVLLVGDLSYYGRMGFRPASPCGIVMSDERPERLLAVELQRGALAEAEGPVLPWTGGAPATARRGLRIAAE